MKKGEEEKEKEEGKKEREVEAPGSNQGRGEMEEIYLPRNMPVLTTGHIVSGRGKKFSKCSSRLGANFPETTVCMERRLKFLIDN